MSASEARFWENARECSRFFMGTSDVEHALLQLAATLDQADIPYAIAGAMALNEYGYLRVTSDVDVLLTREGLADLKSRVLGRGYVEKFPGSRGLRDTTHNVNIDVLLAFDYPGDGKPKPVQFPDPAVVARRGKCASFLPLSTLVELKLASGSSAPHRLKDLSDVLELIRVAKLDRALGDELDESVRAKYLELWEAAQTVDLDY